MTSINNNDFLTLTRENEWSLSPFDVEHDKCKIQVWDTGVMYIEPNQADNSKSFIFSSAVHGNETAPIEICDELITDVLNGKLTPKHPVLFIFGNPASINIEKRFVEENMNRLFSGAHSKGTDPQGRATNKERQRAEKLEQYVTRFFDLYPQSHKTHYDLHTAIRDSAHEKFAVYPYLHGNPWQKQQFEILRAMGVTTFLLMQKPATTFSYYSSNTHGAEAFTVELGKVRPFGQNDQSKFKAAKETLQALLLGTEFDGQKFESSNYQLLSVYREINKHYEDFKLHFADDLANFTQFNKGDVIASENGDDILVEQDGEAIVFPNANVEIGQRALLMVTPTDINHNLV
ncbi:MAG: succinylglutamate desuccinylase [Gammaproteobacteria bacterium]|nr:succinylglutamate desuccinylase [Gammaproteobacteria bacterium]